MRRQAFSWGAGACARVGASLLAASLLAPLPGALAKEKEEVSIPWIRNLPQAFEEASTQDRPLMICIVAVHVDGGRFERAGQELRENTYRDPDVVRLARERFVCAFLDAGGASEDFGELRGRFQIDGLIVSPQHVFVYPDGKLISRHEYWPHGTGKSSVKALLDLMNKALAQDRARRGLGAEGPGPRAGDAAGAAPAAGATPAPEDPDARTAWIQDCLRDVREGRGEPRREALAALMLADRDGDCVGPLLAVLEELKKRPDALADVVRALGRPGLEAAVRPLGQLLEHRENTVRANAAVSLEYVGSKAAVADLTRAAPKEKDERIANHMYRALGRCGAGDAKVRALLVKKALGAKTPGASFGPVIGLAYFEQDPKTAREVEDVMKKDGLDPGRRGRGGYWGAPAARRALLLWCLTETGFGDPKARKFIEEEMMPAVTPSRWTEPILAFYRSAAEVCAGQEESRSAVVGGVQFALDGMRSGRGPPGFGAPTGPPPEEPLLDDARRGRGDAGFTPKADWGVGDGT